MKNKTLPFAIEMLIFFFIIMASFLVYTLLVKDTLNEYIEKYEEIELKHVYELKDKSEHVYETEVLTADAVPLTCRVYYTCSNNNCSLEDVVNYCESIIKHSSFDFLNCHIVDILSNKDKIKEKIKYKCFEKSSNSFEIKVQKIEFIL